MDRTIDPRMLAHSFFLVRLRDLGISDRTHQNPIVCIEILADRIIDPRMLQYAFFVFCRIDSLEYTNHSHQGPTIKNEILADTPAYPRALAYAFSFRLSDLLRN
jgi:hypothetical protein